MQVFALNLAENILTFIPNQALKMRNEICNIGLYTLTPLHYFLDNF